MTIRKRLIVIVSLLAIASVLYGAARYYSPALILFVVEQSLLQKAPSGIDPAVVHERFRARIAATQDRGSQIQKLIQISQYLEKLQYLTLEQFNALLSPDKLNIPTEPISGLGSSSGAGQMAGGYRPTQACLSIWNFISLEDVIYNRHVLRSGADG